MAKFGQNPGQDVSLTSLQDGFDQDRLRDQTATTVAPAVGKILGVILLRKQTLDEKCICTFIYIYILVGAWASLFGTLCQAYLAPQDYL